MEPVDGRRTKTSKLAKDEQDAISNLPDNVITNILDRLRIRDAVRTGILSREWRFKWNMLTHLVFDSKDSLSVSETCYTGNDISRLLFQLKGTVTKFVLYLPDPTGFKVEDVSLWIMFFSRKGIQEFTLINYSTTPFKMPTHLFSCLELKNLKLKHCHFCPPPSFRGFPNLSSLELDYLSFENASFGDFINWCPSLEILKFCDYGRVNQMKLGEIARFRNLKTLAFPLLLLDNIATTSFSIFQLFGFLPKLQNLDLDFSSCYFVAEAAAINRLPTAFSSLRTLTLSEIDISNGIMLSCVFQIICGCPNLQTLKITTNSYYALMVSIRGITSSEVDYNSVGQFQLRSVVFEGLVDTENVVSLIMCILARSPLLKKVSIHPFELMESNEKLMFARKLLKLHRASPVAEIDFVHFDYG